MREFHFVYDDGLATAPFVETIDAVDEQAALSLARDRLLTRASALQIWIMTEGRQIETVRRCETRGSILAPRLVHAARIAAGLRQPL